MKSLFFFEVTTRAHVHVEHGQIFPSSAFIIWVEVEASFQTFIANMHSAFCSLDPVKFDIAVQEMKPWKIDISKGISIPTLFPLNHHGISVTRHFLKAFGEVDPCPLHRHYYKPIINCLSPYSYNTQSLSSVCRFRTWVIMAPHNLLSLAVPSNIFPIVILPSLPSAIHLHMRVK